MAYGKSANIMTLRIDGPYFLMKWGINRSPGISKKAGKVIRLKKPKTTTPASMAEAKVEERCFTDC
jgi:hypothetical protein